MPNQTSENETSTTKTKPSFWLDFGPLLVFFIAFQVLRRGERADDAILLAAGLFAVCAVIALGFSWIKHKTIPPMLILSTVIIVFTASLAIIFDNKTIFYMKPTIVNLLFGVGVIGGVFFKRNVIELMLGNAIKMDLPSWNKLAIRWGLFFFAMAMLNEIIWRTQTENFWVNFKVFGFLPLTILFTVSQLPFIQKYGEMKTGDDI